MPPLPVISGSDLRRVLEKAGYRASRQRGSHLRMTAPGRAPVTVPLHASLDRGTLRSILRVSEISAEEPLKLLE